MNSQNCNFLEIFVNFRIDHFFLQKSTTLQNRRQKWLEVVTLLCIGSTNRMVSLSSTLSLLVVAHLRRDLASDRRILPDKKGEREEIKLGAFLDRMHSQYSVEEAKNSPNASNETARTGTANIALASLKKKCVAHSRYPTQCRHPAPGSASRDVSQEASCRWPAGPPAS